MSTTFGALLRSRLAREQSERPAQPASRPPRHDATYRTAMAKALEKRNARLQIYSNMRAGDLPGTLEAKTAPRPAVRWTQYGYWNDGATAVYSAATGERIYDATAYPTRPRR